MKQIRTKSFS